MDKMMYYSTNRKSPDVCLSDALLTGQAPDKGLYMPRRIPCISSSEMNSLREKSYAEIAAFILGKFASDTFSTGHLWKLCENAYDFEVPLERVVDRRYVMRLDRGPTASFKDFAAKMMGRMIGALMEKQDRELVILTATSGDTGSAIAHAFYGIPNIKVMVLFPPAEVSNRQRKQMTTLGGNISTVGVDGKFDDCQALVKQAFADPDLKSIYLTSANSINIGRLLPQIVYYIYSYVTLSTPGEQVVFSVPSGNFGDMMGALLGQRMGLPLKKLIIATNANNEVPVFLETGVYSKIIPSRVCISNAMNVGHPSNFARVIDLYGGFMDETGKILVEPDIEKMRNELWPISIDDAWTRETIRSAWKKYNLLLEPHGAVGWAALERYVEQTGDDGLMISVETAHPAKFPEEIKRLLDVDPEVPPSLADIEAKSEQFDNLAVDYNAFKTLLKERYES
jgi:threonine synthase